MNEKRNDDIYYVCTMIEYVARVTKNHRKDIVARISKKNKTVTICRTIDPITAFNSYKVEKENYIKEVADEYKSKYPNFPIKLYEAMYKWEVSIND